VNALREIARRVTTKKGHRQFQQDARR
jgi:hypothetical protein